jgi:DNA primase
VKFFEQYFKDVNFEGQGEVKVLCPFHNDSSPSASVNTEKNVFHCWVCKEGYTEAQFISKVNNISLTDASKVMVKFNETVHNWLLVEKAELWANPTFLKRVEDLGLNYKVIEDLNLGIIKDEQGRFYLGFPVYYNGVLMDTRRYNLLKYPGVPKLLAQEGSESGFIIPYDIWKSSTETTYVFEGEKDMAMARNLGINGITLTGGAGSTPNSYIINSFKDRDVVICYDNDDAGRSGMKHLYNQIKNIVKSVRYIDIGEVVKEKGEDFYDYIIKYKQDVTAFFNLPLKEFVPEDEKPDPTTTIKDAMGKNTIKRRLKTPVIVSAEYSDTYAVPSIVEVEKVSETKSGDMLVGEKKSWLLEKFNHYQILELMEVNAKKEDVNNHLKQYSGSDKDGVKVNIIEYQTVYKVKVIDKGEDNNNFSLDLYTFSPMVVGRQYNIDYTIFPHPTKNQKVIAIASGVDEIDDFKAFKPDRAVLDLFRKEGTVEQRLNFLFQSARHHVANHLSYDIWLLSDLVFNSVLEFEYNGLIRGSLDVFILGDTQVGKSETTSALTKLYSFGHFLSLKTSSTVGLIGGSNKVEGTWLNTIGAIPRQHGKLVVLEEFSGAQKDFIKMLTDIRSSGILRLARAAGELTVPCRLRMISISNPISDEQGHPRFLSTFPNGVTPIMELIKSAEDVARYDAFLLVERIKERFNPFINKLVGSPVPQEHYYHKIRWAATRNPKQVVFAEGTDSYIWEKSEGLNKDFECNFPLFGTTTSQKLARLSVALASLLVNTDDKYEKVIVTKEIVDYVISWLYKIYDNNTFKLREYKAEFESYAGLNKEEMAEVQKMYPKNATLFDFIVSQASTSRNNLRVISGLETDDFAKIFNRMAKYKFIKLHGETVFPTEKLRLAMAKVDKSIRVDIGEIQVDLEKSILELKIGGKGNGNGD